VSSTVAVTRDSIAIFSAPNRGGRPRVAEARIPISSRVTPQDYDRIASAAARQGISVAAFVRAIVRRAVAPPKPGR
jgi:hypothetical protein